MKTVKNKEVIDREVAIVEVRNFLNHFNRKQDPSDQNIEELYPDVLEAVQLGLLVFNGEKSPVLTLEKPIENDEGIVSLSSVEFRTRIKPSTKANLSEGIDLRKQAVKYSLNVVAYIIDQPKPMLDKFSPFDYDVIQQVSSVFS